MDPKFSKHLPKRNMLFWFTELENWKKYIKMLLRLVFCLWQFNSYAMQIDGY